MYYYVNVIVVSENLWYPRIADYIFFKKQFDSVMNDESTKLLDTNYFFEEAVLNISERVLTFYM